MTSVSITLQRSKLNKDPDKLGTRQLSKYLVWYIQNYKQLLIIIFLGKHNHMHVDFLSEKFMLHE